MVQNFTRLVSGALLALVALTPSSLTAQDAPADAGDAIEFRFERQLRVNPFDPAALNNLAVVKAGQGRYDDALDLLQRATRLAPQSLEIRANLDRLRAWMTTLGRDPAALEAPELSLSQVPPEPPRLWDPSLPR
jgi:Flp pilus assembly protein TadD